MFRLGIVREVGGFVGLVIVRYVYKASELGYQFCFSCRNEVQICWFSRETLLF